MAVFTFDPANLHVILGSVKVTGWAEGTFFKIEYNADRYSLTMGADGLGARTKSNDKSAKMTLTLMPNSPANLVLDGMQKLDDAADAGALPVTVRDMANGDTFFAEGAWVVKDPGREVAKDESTPIEWTLETDNLVAVHGTALI